jgi:hypothetical protein
VSTIEHVRRGSPEWDAAWAFIAAKYGSTSCESDGECWEYMGTYHDDDGIWKHQFRHRMLSDSRVYEDVPASDGWAPSEADTLGQYESDEEIPL